MKNLLLLCMFFYLINYTQAQQDTMTFYSSKEFNQYRFERTNLNELTTGYLLDMEEEWTKNQLDSFILMLQETNTNVGKLLATFNCMERTDVNFNFEKDDLLFPVMDHYYSADKDWDLNVPLFIIDYEFSRLKSAKRKEIDAWTSINSYNAFSSNDFETENIFCISFFGDTIRNKRIHLYWNDKTVLSNKNRIVSSVYLTINEQKIELINGDYFDLSPFIQDRALSQIKIEVTFSDYRVYEKTCTAYFTNKAPENSQKSGGNYGYYEEKHIGDWNASYGDHALHYTIFYSECGGHKFNKPFIMVAGWGPYVENAVNGPTINAFQGWPSDEFELYAQWDDNSGLITWLREAGYDVIIARFKPPNASVRKNVDKLKELINWVNENKASSEENIILGYSAGAMSVRLALQEMEKEHLENNGPHPHTKLYISYDGEHGGAHIPLAVQHSVVYLDEYQYYDNIFKVIENLEIYALYYILNAPLSKELLYYFHTKTGNTNNPGQGMHSDRQQLLNWHAAANHAKSTNNKNYPAFSRNISLSNGMSESKYSNSYQIADHYPYPIFAAMHFLFVQYNDFREWHVWFSRLGGNSVFKYWKSNGSSWKLKMDATTNYKCMPLDNAAGGIIFIGKKENPLVTTMERMRKAITIGDPILYSPHTLFCFTPTIFTHDIRNFNPAATSYAPDYSMKKNLLMFQSKINYNEYLLDTTISNLQFFSSDYFGYPHIAHPSNHYNITPFDAVFAYSKNTEHIRFNTCNRDEDPDYYNYKKEWWRVPDYSTLNTASKFIFDEADYHNSYIQNRRYGWNARDDYTYKAEIIVPNEIHAGKEVTQRTDFKPVVIEANADVTFRAGEAIYLEEGFEIKEGATFLAEIVSYPCDVDDYFSKIETNSGNNNDNYENIETEFEIDEDIKKQVVVYPNPSDGTINLRHRENKHFYYWVNNLFGNEIKNGESEKELTTFSLPQGVFIIKIQTDENTEIHKVISR